MESRLFILTLLERRCGIVRRLVSILPPWGRTAGNSWWARKDLNLGPMDYESTALTAELRAQTFICYDLRASSCQQRSVLSQDFHQSCWRLVRDGSSQQSRQSR